MHGNEFTRIYRDTFIDMKTRPNFSEKYDNYKQGLINGKNRYKRVDEHRKEGTMRDILVKDVAVLTWYDSI
jgi:hypothetical protein